MIPNICHYIFGLKEQTEDFLFCYYLSIYSCYIVNKPDIIYFYYYYEPYGKWYNMVKKIPNIVFEKVKMPFRVGKKSIDKVAHKADALRMVMLYERGGIYLDIDTICVKPWKSLLNNSVVMGKEHPRGLCNAIMMTEAKSKFFDIWLAKYEYYFCPEGWGEASVLLPELISKKYSDLIHTVESSVFFLPHCHETEKIFITNNDIPEDLIALHLWEGFSLKYIKEISDWNWTNDNSHTLYGKIMLKLKYYK